MDKSTIDEILSNIPGSMRAKHGVLIPGKDGSLVHLQDMITAKESEGLTSDEIFFCAFCSKKEILRLREIKGGHDYLLRLRANAVVDCPRAVRVMRSRKSDLATV